MSDFSRGEVSGPSIETPESQKTDSFKLTETPNSSVEVEGSTYYTDDNCELYKVDDNLCPDNEYSINDICYKTDSDGQITEFEGDVKYNPENERDENAQLYVGGEDRLEGDDGGHLIARILDGSPGVENMVPMRDTINRGDYKRAENEMVSALNDGSDVHVKGEIIREDPDTTRPTKIEIEYEYSDKEGNNVDKVVTFDNVKGSMDLMEDARDEIPEEKLASFEQELSEMQDDGHEVSVTSIVREYDEDGNVTNVSIRYRDETEGEKMERKFTLDT